MLSRAFALAGFGLLDIAFLSVFACASPPTAPSSNEAPKPERQSVQHDQFRENLRAYLKRRPRAQAQDIYKFVHQAVRGPAHAVTDAGAARAWMEREIATNPPRDEPLIEPLSGDLNLVRVYLGPYLAAGKAPQALVDAFVRTANTHRATSPKAQTRELETLLTIALDELDALHQRESASPLLAHGSSTQGTTTSPEKPSADSQSMREFIDRLREQGFPAVHHSEIYRQLYRPAYRVVARDQLDVDLE